MDSTGPSDIVRAHQLGIIQKDWTVAPGHKNGVAILRLDQVTIGKIGCIIRSGKAMACQRCEERPQASGQISHSIGQVAENSEGFVCGTDTSKTFSSVLRRISGLFWFFDQLLTLPFHLWHLCDSNLKPSSWVLWPSLYSFDWRVESRSYDH